MSSANFETDNFDIIHPFGVACRGAETSTARRVVAAPIELGPKKGDPTRGSSAGTHITTVFLPLSFYDPRRVCVTASLRIK